MSTERSSSSPSGIDQEKSTASSQATAGRELDALIAEKVMGISVTWLRDGLTTLERGTPYFVPSEGQKGYRTLPFYSTDIVDSWEVVEKLTSPQLSFYLRFVSTWTAEFVAIYDGASESADADTAPLAICLAALSSFPDSTKEGEPK